jgi:hypothetical protein
LQYWLYAEPHLANGEDAVFAAYESHRLMSIDGEEAARRCWGDPKGSEAYRRTDRLCRLHILPGRHIVAVQVGVTDRQAQRVEFTAEAGKVYGLDWSACRTSLQSSVRDCRIQIIEVKDPVREP